MRSRQVQRWTTQTDLTAVIVVVTSFWSEVQLRSSCRFSVAVHVLAVLAYKAGEPVTSELLAASVNTNPVVVRRLLRVLQRAGLVETRKGAGLGSRLRKEPHRISLAEVYRAVESDELFAFSKRTPDRSCPVGQTIHRTLEKIFDSAQRAMLTELARTTLADVLKTVKANCAKESRLNQAR